MLLERCLSESSVGKLVHQSTPAFFCVFLPLVLWTQLQQLSELCWKAAEGLSFHPRGFRCHFLEHEGFQSPSGHNHRCVFLTCNSHLLPKWCLCGCLVPAPFTVPFCVGFHKLLTNHLLVCPGAAKMQKVDPKPDTTCWDVRGREISSTGTMADRVLVPWCGSVCTSLQKYPNYAIMYNRDLSHQQWDVQKKILKLELETIF